MHTCTDIQIPAAGRKRGRYPSSFKAQLVAACAEPGVSTAAIALANGLNANLLRRWVSEHRQAQGSMVATSDSSVGFVALTSPVAAGAAAALPPASLGAPGQDRLHLSLSRGELQASLSLPADQHSQCAAILKLLLS